MRSSAYSTTSRNERGANGKFSFYSLVAVGVGKGTLNYLPLRFEPVPNARIGIYDYEYEYDSTFDNLILLNTSRVGVYLPLFCHWVAN